MLLISNITIVSSYIRFLARIAVNCRKERDRRLIPRFTTMPYIRSGVFIRGLFCDPP